jgi:hypothetical protein
MRLLLIIIAVIALLYLVSRGSTKGWIQENRWKVIGGAVGIGILLLVVTGKLPALAAIAAPIAAFGRRLWSLRGLLSMFPQLRQILGLGAAAGAGAAHANSDKPPRVDEPMTVKRAAEILGVEETASPAEIRAAHRKLMGKMHPDKDGTDFLAALINEARDFLIARHEGTS